MYDWKNSAELSAKYWETVPTDNPNTINGFAGTFNFSDHSLIPQALLDFISERFYKVVRFSRIPLEDINNALNEVWEGPGSMPKLIRMTSDMREARRENIEVDTKALDKYEVPTIDDDLTVTDLEVKSETN